MISIQRDEEHTQMPEIYIDQLMPHLTHKEFVVLCFTVRHDPVALTVKDYAAGTRIRQGDVRRALFPLVLFKIIRKTEDGYALQPDETLFNMKVLINRHPN